MDGGGDLPTDSGKHHIQPQLMQRPRVAAHSDAPMRDLGVCMEFLCDARQGFRSRLVQVVALTLALGAAAVPAVQQQYASDVAAVRGFADDMSHNHLQQDEISNHRLTLSALRFRIQGVMTEELDLKIRQASPNYGAQRLLDADQQGAHFSEIIALMQEMGLSAQQKSTVMRFLQLIEQASRGPELGGHHLNVSEQLTGVHALIDVLDQLDVVKLTELREKMVVIQAQHQSNTQQYGEREGRYLDWLLPVYGALSLLIVLALLRRDVGIRKLQQALVEAQAADKAKSNFLATMSHELRTPLNAVIGFAELMECEVWGPLGGKDDKYRGYAGDIGTSARHLLCVIEDILRFAQAATTGSVELREEMIHLHTSVANMMKMVSQRAQEKGITLNNFVSPDLPLLVGDQTKVNQALLNIMINAVKFTDVGSVTVSAEVEPTGWLAVRIVDTGIGIDQADISSVGVAFHQIDRLSHTKQEGAGLGVAISRQIITAHGGTLTVESVGRGQGVTVTVRFPSGRVMDPESASS